jgi:hypothetical protein
MEVTRRELLKFSVAAMIAEAISSVSLAADDPLPSWNDSAAKRAILAKYLFALGTLDGVGVDPHRLPKLCLSNEHDQRVW